MKRISGIDELRASVGEELGVSAWHVLTQERVNAFADATGDDYWIHVDPDRAAASELGGTIVHGLFTLSLGPMFTYSLVSFEGFSLTLNYGYEKVRFPAPLPTGSRSACAPDWLRSSTFQAARRPACSRRSNGTARRSLCAWLLRF